MTEHQKLRLRNAMRDRCASKEVLDEVVDLFHYFSSYEPYLWLMVEQSPSFKTKDDVATYVADNW